MKIGAVMFFTTDSMRPAPLARALEERGFESLWVPEHTHIPSTRKTAYPAGGGLIRPYYEIMDPFLALNELGLRLRLVAFLGHDAPVLRPKALSQPK